MSEVAVEVELSPTAAEAAADALAAVVTDRVASRLFAQDPTLWGEDAQDEAGKRLGWTDLATDSRPLVAEIEQLRADLAGRGLDHVVLCGMGGSSLAPEVICRAADVELTVLDSSQPDMVRAAIADRLERSVVVVSSKSGGTVETDSQRRAYEQALRDAGLDPEDHLVVVTDPGSPLDEEATAAGYHVFHADPGVGGRYSALTAFGLVPSGLAGAPIGRLLDEAAGQQAALADDSPDNPALRLGVAAGVAAVAGIDKLVLDDHTGWGLGDWIEQLVAESTGKIGRGILPVVVPASDAVNASPSTADSLLVAIGTTLAPQAESGRSAALDGSLGAQMLLWEAAVTIAGREIGINPFDQPDVESAKQAARDKLGDAGRAEDPDVVAEGIAAHGTRAETLEDAVDQLIGAVDPDHGYIAVQAYLDRVGESPYAELRELLARRTGRPVTFGWGPRFLHSTGQYHKGGPSTGVFLQITCDPREDLPVPGRKFTFGEFIASQAAGDADVLRGHGRPVLRLHLSDVDAALARLRELVS
ncbi:glucose-6-phosphate isomerase [Aeromicrobium sp. CF4.19]|uniref:glucose-6-phosphate isomerase n=1 Tax=Aeromicrobium sp. CF4.19 TaxID=3373082 RepID=UPI003EE7AD20